MASRLLVYLVLDDDVAGGRLTRLLQDAGYEVKAFDTVDAFIELAPFVAAGCVLAAAELVRCFSPARSDRRARLWPHLPVVVVSSSTGDVALAVRCLKSGAVDYLESPCGDERLLQAVGGVLDDLHRAERQDQQTHAAAARIAEMSVREREVLHGLLGGGTNKTIGRQLGISPRTVEIHRAHVMDRLGASSLPEAVTLALTAGLKPTTMPAGFGRPATAASAAC